jgi:hypothetical protein
MADNWLLVSDTFAGVERVAITPVLRKSSGAPSHELPRLVSTKGRIRRLREEYQASECRVCGPPCQLFQRQQDGSSFGAKGPGSMVIEHCRFGAKAGYFDYISVEAIYRIR